MGLPGGKTLDEGTACPCQVYTGSYVGTGTSGQNNPTTLTFPFEPKLVFVADQQTNTVINRVYSFAFIRGMRYGLSYGTSQTNPLTLNWSGNTFSSALPYSRPSGENSTETSQALLKIIESIVDFVIYHLL